MIKVGLIGLGYWGKKWFSELQYLHEEGSLDFAGVCDIEVGKLANVSDQVFKTTLPRELAERCDACVVATTTQSHYPLASLLLADKKHILLEKPIAELEAEAKMLAGESEDQKLVLMPGHMYRFSDVIRELKRIVFHSGERPQGINFRWTDFLPYRDTDILLDLLPHVLDITKFIRGEFPLFYASIGSGFRSQHESMDLYGATDGVRVGVELSYGLPIRHRSIEIVYQERAIFVDPVSIPDRITFVDYALRNSPGIEYNRVKYVPANNTLRDEMRFFLKHVENNEPVSDMLQDALQGLKIINELQTKNKAMHSQIEQR